MCHNGAHASGVEMSITHSADKGHIRSTHTRIMRLSGGLRRLAAQGSRPSAWLTAYGPGLTSPSCGELCSF